MKNTGIVRKIDRLGRIVIPKEIRNTLRILDDDNLELLIDGENIVLKKYSYMKNFADIAKNLLSNINFPFGDVESFFVISKIGQTA